MTHFAILNPAKAGRPYDPRMEERILRAALGLYEEAGWVGFNLTKVAAEAGIDKSSLYSRWDDRDELLHHAFTALVICPGPRGDSPWEILVSGADFRLREYPGPDRSTVRQLFVGAGNAEGPAIYQIYKDLFVTPLSAIRECLRDFKLNDELPRNTSVVRLLDTVKESVLMRTFCLPGDVITYSLERVSAYAADPVNGQLRRYEPSRQLGE